MARNHPTSINIRLWMLAVVAVIFLPTTTALALPAEGELLLNNQPELFKLTGQAAAGAEAKIISDHGPGFDRAWRIEVRHQPDAEFQLQLVSLVTSKLNPGDAVLMSMWVRAPSSQGPDHQGRVGLILEQSADPFDKVFARRFDIGSDWQRLDVAGKIKQEFIHTSAQIALRLGYFPQTIEIGGLTLRRFDSSVSLSSLPQTPLTYRGREANAPWRTEAEQRIERLRKSALTVHVTGADGKPIDGATVDVHMVRNAFAFGCVYNDGRFPEEQNKSTDDRAYQEHFTQLFNTGVDEAGMKWPSWQDPAKQQATTRALQWMREHDITVRGHCLVWPGWKHLPTDLKTLAADPHALEQQIDNHIQGEVRALNGQVTEWDVVNEPYLNNDLMHVLGDHAMSTWFEIAHQANPSARLYLNETNVPDSPPSDRRYDALFKQVQDLQNQHAPIGGIGMQAHFNDGLTAPADLLSIYDRFATLGIPIRITELDINLTDEKLQADYFRDFLIASFSHPNINGIVLWGFWDQQHWRPDAALFHKDWTLKPNGQVWKDLVLGKWSTHSRGNTNNGTYTTPAFLGDYAITATLGQRSRTIQLSLPHEGASVNIQLN